ncbi:carboxypeptidase-like regulatory domain-containing protein [Polaribacter huanghezhanensis]|uniref:carboxypeptidase-like regulatory domain-containing protein n=1 Tax=Polaribacter huanghezhanensis TaxID=1354726 RepID=UPI002648AC2B|nr:carboxypeptidase-like regulatory domain-containing protein [Polaribacter huanghezhanensis]
MKNLTLLFFFIGISNMINSQEKKSIEIYGIISLDSIPLENAHVINKNTSKGVITNAKGEFKIRVSKSDTLFVSHITIDHKEITITKEIYASKKIAFNSKATATLLEEVVLKKRRSIFYLDPQIMPAYMVNATTLKLPFANTIAKKDKRITKLTLTSISVDLDNLISFFNGKTKKTKELKKIKLVDADLLKIREKLSDFFFEKQLGIQKSYINQFLNFCASKNIISNFKKGNHLKLTEILIRESKVFPLKKINEETLLTKN